MKQIVYVAMCNTIDGMGKPSEVFASLNEVERDNFIKNSENKPWLFPEDKVVDLSKVAIATWEKLEPIEQLSLLMTSCPIWQKDYDIKTVGDEGIN